MPEVSLKTLRVCYSLFSKIQVPLLNEDGTPNNSWGSLAEARNEIFDTLTVSTKEEKPEGVSTGLSETLP